MAGKRKKQSGIGVRHLVEGVLLTAALALLLTPGAPAGAVPVAQDEAEACVSGQEISSQVPQTEAPQVPESQTPAPEPKAPEVPEETAPAQPENASMIVPESEPVEDTYFSDVVFLGDSRTEGFHLYSGLQEGQYLYAVGATVASVFDKATEQTDAGKVPMLDALAQMECGKVYVMLGVNELGWPRSQTYYDQYGKVIDRIRQDHPDAEVVIQSLLPVSASQEAKGTYVNNERIAEYNELLLQLAVEKNCPYVNVAEAVTGEDGCLKPELTSDGVHLNKAGCAVWLDYLRTHPV